MIYMHKLEEDILYFIFYTFFLYYYFFPIIIYILGLAYILFIINTVPYEFFLHKGD